MSYSNTVTQEDLKNVLNEVLPQSRYIQSWEYVGDVYWGSGTWTVPDDGFIEVYAEPSASNWYWRISDSLAPDTGWSHRLTGANDLTVSQIFFVKKGAVIGTYNINAVSTAHVYYYKFTLKETTPESAVDYIVEQGTSGNWTYRKWNSGAAELWWEKSCSIGASSVDNSNYAVYPFAVHGTSVNNAPIITCGLKGGGLDAYRLHIEESSTTTTQARLVLINMYTSPVTLIPQLYIRGFWK